MYRLLLLSLYRTRGPMNHSKYRATFIVNEYVQRTIPCGLCGGPTIIRKSLYLRDMWAIRCVENCGIESPLLCEKRNCTCAPDMH